MMTNPERVLASLRDVAGVEGSWLLGVDGRLLARDLSALYSDAILAALGPRLVQVTDVAAEHLVGYAEDCSLRFNGRTLHLRRVGAFLLVALTLPTTNAQSLRIGTHLVLRQLTAPPPAPSAPLPAPAFPPPRTLPSPQRPPPQAAPRPVQPAAKPTTGIWGN